MKNENEYTLKSIAEHHGFTFSERGEGAKTYVFTRGKLRVTFSKAGHGSMSVTWGGRVVPWNARLPVTTPQGAGTLRLYETTREQYADTLLQQVTEAEVFERLRAKYSEAVETARTALRRAEEDRADVLREIAQAAEPGLCMLPYGRRAAWESDDVLPRCRQPDGHGGDCGPRS